VNFITKWALKTVVGRYVTVGLVTLLLGGAALKWYKFKSDLREEGIQVCVQEINQATMQALEDALADERAANAELNASLVVAATANREAMERRTQAEANLKTLEKQMEIQRNEDPAYRDWSATALPSGVAERLRQAAGSEASSTD
jgi:hypothetical protein